MANNKTLASMPTPQQIRKTTGEYAQNFLSLLDAMENIEPQQKLLWKQIYESAVSDRENAFLAYVDLFMGVYGDKDQHNLNGMILAKYLERMEKSLGQLLRLAEMISEAKKANEYEIPRPNYLMEEIEK